MIFLEEFVHQLFVHFLSVFHVSVETSDLFRTFLPVQLVRFWPYSLQGAAKFLIAKLDLFTGNSPFSINRNFSFNWDFPVTFSNVFLKNLNCSLSCDLATESKVQIRADHKSHSLWQFYVFLFFQLDLGLDWVKIRVDVYQLTYFRSFLTVLRLFFFVVGSNNHINIGLPIDKLSIITIHSSPKAMSDLLGDYFENCRSLL